MWGRVQCKIEKQWVAKTMLTRSAGSFSGPGADFWPRRISKGVPKSTIFETNQKKMRKRRSKKRLKKNMIFVSIFHWISDGFWSHFWCFFDTFTIRTCNLPNHHIGFSHEFQWFYSSEKHDFPDLFRYQFWHLFFPAKGRQNGSKKRPKWNQKSPRRQIFEILWRSGRRCFFDVFGDRKKSAQNPEKFDTLGRDGRLDY